ncbi:MAG: D-glycero-beta-D-manno-heptose-7-phosphate kinase [Alphaproteobacteria bacterium]|nr:D-glycero-beta-D-manno-heptose-7-phosphate kinase [Alphaproteobacteria bacterium]
MDHANALGPLLEELASVRVLCIGDVMLDRFIYGAVDRVSPEAPIPVLRIEREAQMLGGAGNVVRNIAALGGRATLVAVVGDDDAGRAVARLIGEQPGIDADLVTVAGRATTLKLRYVAGNQQLLRADHEQVSQLDQDSIQRLCAAIESEIADADIVVLSDYAKGVLSPMIIQYARRAAEKAQKLVIADPKSADFTRYAGVSVLTPNAKELAAATAMEVGDDVSAEAAGAKALGLAKADAILVTRSERGMTIVKKELGAQHFPAEAREVFDVSGAGDTVLAVFALALGSGADFVDAAALANVAAGIVVTKAGTAVVRPDELAQALHAADLKGPEAKIKPSDSALDTVARWRARGLKIGFTNGCFDLIHTGHVSLLAQARAACDRLIVGLNTDASVQRLKGPSRPVNTEMARAIVLAALETVDMVVLFDEETPIKLIEAIRPDVLIKGADYTVDQVVGAPFVQSYGGKVVLAALTPGQSTSGTIARMAKQTVSNKS